MSNKSLIILTTILAIILNLVIIVACVRYDNYVKELKEKANKYDLLVNNTEVKDE